MAGQVNLPQYPEFHITEDPDISSKWEDWLEGFESMLGAMSVTEQKNRRTMLLYYMGGSTRKVVKRLDNIGQDTDEDCYEKIITALNNHFTPKLNRVYGMNMLQQVRQRPGETIDNYLVRVKEKIAAIQIDKLNKDQIIELITLTHLVNYCSNKSVKHKAIRDDLSLDNFLKTARAAERAEIQLKDMENRENPSGSVNWIKKEYDKNRSSSDDYGKQRRGRSPFRRSFQRRKSRSQNRRRFSNSPHPKKNMNKSCFRCGGSYPHDSECPAMNKKCEKCSRFGHFAKLCHTKQKSKVHSVQDEVGIESEEEYITVPTVHSIMSPNGKTKWTTVKLYNQNIQVMIDTGAEIDIIDENTFRKLPTDKIDLLPVNRKYCGYGPDDMKKEIEMLGKFECDIKAPTTKRKTKIQVHVIKGKANNLLSCVTSEKLGLLIFTCQVTTEENIYTKYKDRFEGIGKMKGTTVTININKEIKPVAQKPRRTPFHLRDKIEEEMERLKQMDIIEDAVGPTPWISPLVIVHKPNGDIRVCLDSRIINTAIERERHPLNTIEELIVELNGAQYFSKIDLNKGYHQLELAEESRYITTFATHDKLYRYKRLCFGINSAAEIFQKAVADMLRGIPGQMNMSDDIIIYSKTKEEHQRTIEQVMLRLKEFNVTANKQKCEFWKNEIEFFGHVFSQDGISPSKDKVSAIVNASEPKTPDEVRSLIGMAQYLSRFIPNYSSIVEPLRVLTKKKTVWKWTEDEINSFEDLKTSLSNWKTLSYFNTKFRTELIVDASPVGLGSILTQKNSEDNINVVEYASRKLSETESRYSQSEREALAVVWATEHFNHYLIGSEFTVITDHQPLLGIMNKPMSKPTARLHRLCLRLQPYKMTLKYAPGKNNPADYLSRHPSQETVHSDESWLDLQTDNICINALKLYESGEDASITLQELEQETRNDIVIQNVIKCIPDQKWHELDYAQKTDYQSFKRIREELSVVNGLLLRDERIVVPESLRERAVRLAHSSHQGIVKTKALIRETIWFPGIDRMVEQKVENCLSCQSCTWTGEVNREPAKMTKLPSEPWKEVSMDFCGPFPGGEYLLVVMDDYSRYPEVEILYSTSANATIPVLDAIFSRQGIPEVAKSDNGPPFNSEQFKSWTRYIGLHHRKITPRWPEANGEVERFMRTLNKAVKTAKIEKGNWKQEIYKFLRHYRATPHSTTSISPCEMLNGRKLKTELPVRVRRKAVRFKDQVELAERKDQRLKEYMKELADERKGARESNLSIGENVLVKQDKVDKFTPPYDSKPYKIKSKKGSMITAERSDKRITRNASHFKRITEQCAKASKSQDFIEEENEIEIENEPESKKEVPETHTFRSKDLPPVTMQSRPERKTKMPSKYDDFIMYTK